MRKIVAFFVRISNWKTFVLFLVLYTIFPAYILKNAESRIHELAGKETGVIDLTVGFNPGKTLDMVADYGAEGRAYVAKVESTIDIIYPIVYAFLFAIILTLIYRNRAWVSLVPFVTMIFDFCENLCIITLLNSYPEQSYTWATLCEIFKLLKWVSFGIIVLLIVYGLISKWINKDKQVAAR